MYATMLGAWLERAAPPVLVAVSPRAWWHFGRAGGPLASEGVNAATQPLRLGWLRLLSVHLPGVGQQAAALAAQAGRDLEAAAAAAGRDLSLAPGADGGGGAGALHVCLTVVYAMLALGVLSYSFGWLFWLLMSVLLTVLQLGYALYQLVRIVLDVSLFSTIKFWSTVARVIGGRANGKAPRSRRQKSLLHSKSLKSFESLAALDEVRRNKYKKHAIFKH
jgi:hypothetical protein